MRFFKRDKSVTQSELPFGGLPRYDIVPAPHGQWRLRCPSVAPCYESLKPYWIMESVGLYKTREAAEKDARHLGLD